MGVATSEFEIGSPKGPGFVTMDISMVKRSRLPMLGESGLGRPTGVASEGRC